MMKKSSTFAFEIENNNKNNEKTNWEKVGARRTFDGDGGLCGIIS